MSCWVDTLAQKKNVPKRDSPGDDPSHEALSSAAAVEPPGDRPAAFLTADQVQEEQGSTSTPTANAALGGCKTGSAFCASGWRH